MTLREKIQADMIAATKARDPLKTDCLRMAISTFKNKEIDKKAPLDDGEVTSVLQTLIKQRKESVEMYAKGGRQDLVDKESAEIRILEAYLPSQIDDASLASEISAVIRETGAAGPKDMGKVMKAAMTRLAGRAEGGRISAAVKAQLT